MHARLSRRLDARPEPHLLRAAAPVWGDDVSLQARQNLLLQSLEENEIRPLRGDYRDKRTQLSALRGL